MDSKTQSSAYGANAVTQCAIATVWMFEHRPGETLVVKTGCDSSDAKRSAIAGVSRVLEDDHYKQTSHVTVGVER